MLRHRRLLSEQLLTGLGLLRLGLAHLLAEPLLSTANGDGCPVSAGDQNGQEQCARAKTVIDVNLPVTAVAGVLVTFFLDLKTPEGALRDKLARINFMLVHSRIHSEACAHACVQWKPSHYFKLQRSYY